VLFGGHINKIRGARIALGGERKVLNEEGPMLQEWLRRGLL
jgi:hypothetical protein